LGHGNVRSLSDATARVAAGFESLLRSPRHVLQIERLQKLSPGHFLPRPARNERGLPSLGMRRKEFAHCEGPPRAERAGASESLGRGLVAPKLPSEGGRGVPFVAY